MHLTTSKLIFGPKVDIQHFNVSSCQQLASTMHLTTMQLILVQRGYSTFNVSSCQQLASQYYAPHYYANWIFGPGVIFNILMCPLCQQSGLLLLCTPTTMCKSDFVKSGYSTF
jgi:hypothetical protein